MQWHLMFTVMTQEGTPEALFRPKRGSRGFKDFFSAGIPFGPNPRHLFPETLHLLQPPAVRKGLGKAFVPGALMKAWVTQSRRTFSPGLSSTPELSRCKA